MAITAQCLAEWPNYQVDARSGAHTIRMDEPPGDGGLDQGPGPFDMVVLGLASCTLITLRLYLENKKLELPDLHVELDHEMDEKGIKLVSITRKVTLKPAKLDDSTVADYPMDRLLHVANRCPVHNLLAPVVPITTTVELAG